MWISKCKWQQIRLQETLSDNIDVWFGGWEAEAVLVVVHDSLPPFLWKSMWLIPLGVGFWWKTHSVSEPGYKYFPFPTDSKKVLNRRWTQHYDHFP